MINVEIKRDKTWLNDIFSLMKKNSLSFLVSLSAAGAALFSLTQSSSVSPSEPSSALQSITVPDQFVISPSTVDTSVAFSDHESHASHASHASHSSHYSGY